MSFVEAMRKPDVASSEDKELPERRNCPVASAPPDGFTETSPFHPVDNSMLRASTRVDRADEIKTSAPDNLTSRSGPAAISTSSAERIRRPDITSVDATVDP